MDLPDELYQSGPTQNGATIAPYFGDFLNDAVEPADMKDTFRLTPVLTIMIPDHSLIRFEPITDLSVNSDSLALPDLRALVVLRANRQAMLSLKAIRRKRPDVVLAGALVEASRASG